MDPGTVLDIARESMVLAAKLAAPVLITALVVGFVVSLLQSVTQIQEVTLAFVPKAIAAALALAIAGQWMIESIVQFTTSLWGRIPTLVAG
ncbi:MAG: flagellar biosynthesis protein FliQ [Micrococcales bacterium]|nr:flagellar biosynthesis protein FliQ [Micrococcales bacterium]MCL2668396.1 flagellar biosynthesis protein FliQ [Micrococcales bacterium]